MEPNCRNCGAPVSGGVCEYCGTPTDRFAKLVLGKPLSVRFEANGAEYEFEMIVDGFNFDAHADTNNFYADGMCYYTAISEVEYRTAFSGSVVAHDGVMIKVKNRK